MKNFFDSVLTPFLFFLLLPLFVVLLLMPAPHEQKQVCPQCGKRKGRHVGDTVHEGMGRRSWTDLVVAEYKCKSCGHTFAKDWTAASGFD